MAKYVITDPCYIVDEKTWDKCLKDFPNFPKLIAEHLTKLTKENAYASDTGFGDWSNALFDSKGCIGYFGADSGMVSVCKYTKKVAERLSGISAGCYCVFEADGPLDVVFDTSNKQWTVVNIKDAVGNEFQTLMPDDGYDVFTGD